MSGRAVLWPVLAMVALTFVVSIVMYRRRIAENGRAAEGRRPDTYVDRMTTLIDQYCASAR